MSFTGKEGAEISIEEAKAMIGRYRTKYATKAGSSEPSNRIYCVTGREIVEKILAQEGCVGIRTYFTEADDGMLDIVMTGVDKDQNDLTNVIANHSVGKPPLGDGGRLIIDE